MKTVQLVKIDNGHIGINLYSVTKDFIENHLSTHAKVLERFDNSKIINCFERDDIIHVMLEFKINVDKYQDDEISYLYKVIDGKYLGYYFHSIEGININDELELIYLPTKVIKK